MGFWLMLFMYVVAFVAADLMRPKPKSEAGRPSGLGDFQFPTATEGRVIPVIWGRVLIKGPNIVWYGDFRIVPVWKTVAKNMFSDTEIIAAYRYHIGIQFAICRGPVSLVAIQVDKEQVWGGGAPLSAQSVYSINDPNFFGGTGDGTTGGGGLVGGGTFYIGSEFQNAGAYLVAQQSSIVAYRGTSYITWEGGDIGNAATLRPYAFEVERYPNQLVVTNAGEERIGNENNPMCVLYEILTNDEWGLSLQSSVINVINLRVLATQLKAEGNGWAFIWDSPKDVIEIIHELERQVDGFLSIDPITGEYNFKLMRFDYTPGTLAKLNESNILKFISMSRSAWDDTTNIVRVQFADPRKNYALGFALAQDMANAEVVKSTTAVTMVFPGVKSHTLANEIAWRELRNLSFPIAKWTLELNRESFSLAVGDVRELNWSSLGISDIPIRATKIDYGNITKGRIRVEFIQDVFGTEIGVFSDPPDTGWVPAIAGVIALLAADQYMEEAHSMLGGSSNRLLFAASANAAGSPISMRIVTDSRTPPTAFDDTYEEDSPTANFVARGTLTDPYPSDTGVNPETSGILEIDPAGTEALPNLVFDSNIDDMNFITANLALIISANTYEYISFKDVNDLGGNRIRLNTVYRGVLDTYPQSHPSGATIWFMYSNTGANESELEYVLDDAVQAKFLPHSGSDDILEAAATALPEVLMNNRQARPPTPSELKMNGGLLWDEDTSISIDLDLDGGTIDRPGVRFEYTERDQRHNLAILRQVSGGDADDEDLLNSLLPYSDSRYENDPLATGKNLRYEWWIYFVDKGTLSSDPTTRRGTASMSGDTGVGPRNGLFQLDRGDIYAANGDAVPSIITLELVAKNNTSSLQSFLPILISYNTITSELTSADDLGDLAINTGSAVVDVSGIGGNVTIKLQRPLDPFGTTIGGEFEYRLDGGAWTRLTTISATGAEGTLSGTINVAAINDLEVRHFHGWGLRVPLEIKDGTTLIAFGILVPEFLDESFAANGSQGLASHNLGDHLPIDFILAATSTPETDILTAAASQLLYVVDDRLHTVRTDPLLAVPRPAGSPETGVYVAHRLSGGGFLNSLKLILGSTYLGNGPEEQTEAGGTANAPLDLVGLLPAATPAQGDVYRVDANIVHAASVDRSKNVRMLASPSPEGVLYNEPARLILVKPGTDAHFSSVTTGIPNPILASAVPTLAGDGSDDIAIAREMRIVVLLSSSQDLSQIYYKIGVLTTNWKALGTASGTVAILDDAGLANGAAALDEIRFAHTIDLDSATTVDIDLFDWSIVGPAPVGGDVNGDAHWGKFVIKLDDV